MKQTPQHRWKSYKPITKHYRHQWNKHWPGLNRMSKRTRNLQNEFHGHPEPSKPFKLWKLRLPSSNRTNMNQNVRYQNMPPETDAGDDHRLFTQCLSRISSSTTSRTNTTKTRSWGTRWRKWSNRIPNWHKKSPVPRRHLRRSSKRTPSWLWSLRQWPRTCSSDIAMDQNRTTTQERRISPHGGNHFSKRKSESENESKNREIVKMKITDSKTKETKRTRVKRSVKESWKVKADKAKAIKRLKTKIRKEIKRWQAKIKEFQALKNSILKFSFYLHFAAAFIISILFFKSISSAHFNCHFMYPFQTFTSGDFKDCNKHFSLQTKALHLAKKAKTPTAILESTRLPRNPETRLTIPTKDLHRNTLVPVTLQLLGQCRISENNPQIDSFQFQYLGPPNPIDLNSRCCFYLGNSAKTYLTNIP
jgi:hypothetical protein